MAHQQPRLVNKQFNSPIGLYSDANIKDIIERESQMLANGAVGIDFHNPSAGSKSANLHNSAVLRMLEEEEGRARSGQNAGFRSDGKPLRAAWPPPGHKNRQRRFTDVVITGVKRVAWPPPREGEENETVQPHEAVQAQGGPQYSQQSGQQAVYRPATPVGSKSSAWSPVQAPLRSPQSNSPLPHQQQQPLYPQQQQQQQQQQSLSPAPGYQGRQSPQPFSQQAQWSPVAGVQAQAVPQQIQPQSQPQPQPQPQYQPVAAPAVKQFEPPPTIITLRPQVPISQAPAPVFASQPATATLRGGKNLRGDLKWPPEDVKTRMEEENRARMELAKGPACRPRKVHKDYSPFFAQHALNSSYPGYKVPPGTQFYEHHPVW